VRRHPGLVALSYEHHHGLLHALRLRRAAAEENPARWLATARDFLRFFADETDAHFTTEEESVFPLVRRHAGDCEPLARELDAEVEHGAVRGDGLAALAGRLEAHIRLEERELFPLLEGLADEAELRRVAEAPVRQLRAPR
jgi:hemerythrin-like domain-containing protein